jgi:CBS-domain-containing membrane protein
MCRTVENVMTRDVVCVNKDTPYKELVKLLATRRVSAVPVIDDRRHVLGVVSEADLLPKQEKPARPPPGCCRRDAGDSNGPRRRRRSRPR